jgi:hypothetical protein
MENQNVPIEMWNINKHRHWTNNADEGWNSILNSTTGKQQPTMFLQLQKLKEAVGILASEIKGTCKAWSKTKKDLCKTRRKNK